MEWWEVFILGIVLIVIGHISGVIFGPFWKKWILKLMGFPEAAVELFMILLRSSTDFKHTEDEKKQLAEKFEKVIETLEPGKIRLGN
jgi:hypothetical protein